MLRVIGADIGNQYLKLYDGRAEMPLIQTVYGRVPEDHQRRVIDLEPRPEEALDVEIKSTNGVAGRFFVGELAARTEGLQLQRLVTQRKAEAEHGPILLAAGLALWAALQSPFEHEVAAAAVVGLPVAHYVHDRKAYAERLKDTYQVTFHRTPAVVPGRRLLVHIPQILVVAEGTAALMNYAFDEGGQLQDAELVEGWTAICDIGAMSVDNPVFEAKRVKPVGQGQGYSTYLEDGLARHLDAVVQEVRESPRFRRYPLQTRQDVVDAILAGGRLEWGRASSESERWIDINPVLDAHLGNFATRVANLIKQVWEENPRIKRYLMVGGGAPVLRPYLDKALEGYPVTYPANPLYANARGFYRLGVAALRQVG